MRVAAPSLADAAGPPASHQRCGSHTCGSHAGAGPAALDAKTPSPRRRPGHRPSGPALWSAGMGRARPMPRRLGRSPCGLPAPPSLELPPLEWTARAARNPVPSSTVRLSLLVTFWPVSCAQHAMRARWPRNKNWTGSWPVPEQPCGRLRILQPCGGPTGPCQALQIAGCSVSSAVLLRRKIPNQVL